MRSRLDVLVWVTAVGLWISIFVFQLRTLLPLADPDESRTAIVIFSFLVATFSQAGLFLTPWAKNWKIRYQLTVCLSMLPSFLALVKIAIGQVSEFILALRVETIGLVGLYGMGIYMAQLVGLFPRKSQAQRPEIA